MCSGTTHPNGTRPTHFFLNVLYCCSTNLDSHSGWKQRLDRSGLRRLQWHRADTQQSVCGSVWRRGGEENGNGMERGRKENGRGSPKGSVLAVTSPALTLSSACDVAAYCCLWQHLWVRGTKETARGSRYGAVLSICCHELCWSGDST